MAKFLPILGELSGSVGADTFSHNKGGAYVRARRTPTNPNTTKQQDARAVLGTLSSAWSSLSDAERSQWTTWAGLNPIVGPLGESVQLSGQQAYVALNARLLQSGEPAITTPPVTTGPAQLDTITVVAADPTDITVTWTPTPLDTDNKLLVWMTMPSTAGRDPNFKQARLVSYSAAADASPTTFTSPYPFSPGDVFNVFVQQMNAAGQVSVPQKVRVTVP